MAAAMILLCLVAFIESGTATLNPGFKTRVTTRAIDYANQVAIDVLAQKLANQNYPDQHGKSGSFSYDITEIHINSFSKPNSVIKIIPNNGLSWQVKGAGISVSGKFAYKYKKKWIKISDHGTFDASADGVSFAIAISVGEDGTGRPKIGSSDCSSGIGSVSLKFHKSIVTWIYNLLKGPLIKEIKKLVREKLCDVLSDAINNDAEKSLGKLKVTVEIAKQFLLDYRLTAPPNFTSDFLETMHKGEIFWKNHVKEAPFTAPQLPPETKSDKMLYLWVSDFLFNSAMFVAQEYKFLEFNLTASDLPPAQQGVLDTSCLILCVGKLIPKIGQLYPHTTVDLEMASTQAPHMDLQDGQLYAKFKGDIKMNAFRKNKDPAYLLTLNSTMNLALSLSVNQEKIYGKIAKLTIDVDVKDSAVGSVNEKALQFLVSAAITVFIKPQLNKVLSNGLPLPMTGSVSFVNIDLKLLSDTMIISTDIAYNSTEMDTSKEDFTVVGAEPSYRIDTV